jgi:HlyD family secretion protein
MVQFLKQHKNKIIWLAIIGVLVIAGFAYANQGNGDAIKYDMSEAKSSALQQSVSATGTLEPKASIDLSFQSSGQVREVLKDTGDVVKRGDILAILENSNETAGLRQAQASLSEAKAALNLEIANATDEEITIARIDVEQADANLKKIGVDLDNARTTYDNTQKTVSEQNRVADLEVKNAEVALKKVQSNTGTTTDQNKSDLDNASFALKNSIGQVLNATSSSIVTVDKLYGFYGVDTLGDPTSYRGDAVTLC